MATHKQMTLDGVDYRLVPEHEWALHWGKRKSAAKTPEPKKVKTEHDEAFHLWKVANWRAWKKEHETAANYLSMPKMNADAMTSQMLKEWNSMVADLKTGRLTESKAAEVQKYIDAAAESRSSGGNVPITPNAQADDVIPDAYADILRAIKKLESELNVTKDMLERDIQAEDWYITYVQTEKPDKPWHKGQSGKRRPLWVTAGLLGLTPKELVAKRKALAKLKCALSPGAASTSDASDDQGRVEDVDEDDMEDEDGVTKEEDKVKEDKVKEDKVEVKEDKVDVDSEVVERPAAHARGHGPRLLELIGERLSRGDESKEEVKGEVKQEVEVKENVKDDAKEKPKKVKKLIPNAD